MYLPESIRRARKLRRRQTEAEDVFWTHVRARRFKGLKFSRQYPIRFCIDDKQIFFIADFFCFEHRLAIEIDGGIHDTQKEYDEMRTYIIEEMGMRVLRFRNREVLCDIEGVLERIALYIETHPKPLS